MLKINFSSKTIQDISTTKTECLVIPIFEDLKVGKLALKIDSADFNFLKSFLSLGDFNGKIGDYSVIPGQSSSVYKRLLLVGAGKKGAQDNQEVEKICIAIGLGLKKTAAKDALIIWPDLLISAKNLLGSLEILSANIMRLNYTYTETLSRPKNKQKLKRVVVLASHKRSVGSQHKSLRMGQSIG